MDESQLRHVWSNRQPRNRIAHLLEPMERLVSHHLARRVKQIGQLSAIWDECIPDFIREHTALIRLYRGVLTVAVDSAAHRYQLQMLLQSGMLQAIRERFGTGPLNSIKLVPGPFDAMEFPDAHARRRNN